MKDIIHDIMEEEQEKRESRNVRENNVGNYWKQKYVKFNSTQKISWFLFVCLFSCLDATPFLFPLLDMSPSTIFASLHPASSCTSSSSLNPTPPVSSLFALKFPLSAWLNHNWINCHVRTVQLVFFFLPLHFLFLLTSCDSFYPSFFIFIYFNNIFFNLILSCVSHMTLIIQNTVYFPGKNL